MKLLLEDIQLEKCLFPKFRYISSSLSHEASDLFVVGILIVCMQMYAVKIVERKFF